MNAEELNKKVLAIAEKYGFKSKFNNSTVTNLHISFIQSKEINYSCSVWPGKKYIESRPQKGYDAMLEAFENNIQQFLKTYSDKKQEIEI